MQSYESVVNAVKFSPENSSGSEENVRASKVTHLRAEAKRMDFERAPKNFYGLQQSKTPKAANQGFKAFTSGKKIPKLDLNQLNEKKPQS